VRVDEGVGRTASSPARRDALLIFATSTALYLPAVFVGYFVADDFFLSALYDPAGGVNWLNLWSYISCQSTSGYFYRPVPALVTGLDYFVWGVNAVGYFLPNVAVHGLIGVLVWATARELGWGRGPGMVAGLATVLHPLHVESVWAVAGRFDLFAGLFTGFALWSYARWLRRPGARLALGLITGYVLAVFSKEAAVTLPLVLAVTLALTRRSGLPVQWVRQGGLLLSLLVAPAGLFLARRLCLGVVVGRYPAGPSPTDPVAMLTGIPRLLLYMVYPAPLPSVPGTSSLVVIAAGVSVLALAGSLLLHVSSKRLVAWSAVATFLLAAPVLSLVGSLERPTDLGRIFLLPALGFGLLVGALFEETPRPAVGLWLVALLLAWGTLVIQYQRPWMERAGVTRGVLKKIERAAGQPGTSQIVVVGLPDSLFGPGNWAFRLAANRPFIDLPGSVTVALRPGPPDVVGGSSRILVWNARSASLEEAREPAPR
jgi:hypothetical protein